MSDTANDLNIDLITSSYISKESSGSALNDSIAANINNIDAIADKLGGDYELAGKVQNAVYANISDYGSKSLALQDRGALEATKDFAVNTVGKGLIGGTLSGIGGALGLASAATGSDMLAEGAAVFSGLSDYARKGSDALLSKAQTDYDTVSHRKADSAYNYNKVKRDTKIANGGDPTIANLGNFLDDVMTAGSHLDMNDLTGATAEGLGNLLGMAATGGVGAVVKGGVMGAAKLGAAKLGATAALEAAQSSKAARILGKVFDAPTRANMMFEAGGGVDNAVEAINSYSDEQLAELSPEFNSLVEQYLQNGASPEEASQQARIDLRNQLIRTNALETGLTGAAIGRLVPGTERGLKSLGGKGLGAGSVAGYVGKAASEGIEEFGQEGSSTLIGNINEKALLNKDKDTLEGVGQGAVMGAVGGIGTSAVANARPGSVLKDIYDKGKEAVGKFKDKDEPEVENIRVPLSSKNANKRVEADDLQSTTTATAAQDNKATNNVVNSLIDYHKQGMDSLQKELDNPESTHDEKAKEKLRESVANSQKAIRALTLNDEEKKAISTATGVNSRDLNNTRDGLEALAAKINNLTQGKKSEEEYTNELSNLHSLYKELKDRLSFDMPEYNQDGSTTKYGEQVAVLNNYLDNNESLLEAEAKVAKQAINNDEIINNKGTNVIPENIKNLGNNPKVIDVSDENNTDAKATNIRNTILNMEQLVESGAELNDNLISDSDGNLKIDKNKDSTLNKISKTVDKLLKANGKYINLSNEQLQTLELINLYTTFHKAARRKLLESGKKFNFRSKSQPSEEMVKVYNEKLFDLKQYSDDNDINDYLSSMTYVRGMIKHSSQKKNNPHMYDMYQRGFRRLISSQWKKVGKFIYAYRGWLKDKNDKQIRREENKGFQYQGVYYDGEASRRLLNNIIQENLLMTLQYNRAVDATLASRNKVITDLNEENPYLAIPDLFRKLSNGKVGLWAGLLDPDDGKKNKRALISLMDHDTLRLFKLGNQALYKMHDRLSQLGVEKTDEQKANELKIMNQKLALQSSLDKALTALSNDTSKVNQDTLKATAAAYLIRFNKLPKNVKQAVNDLQVSPEFKQEIADADIAMEAIASTDEEVQAILDNIANINKEDKSKSTDYNIDFGETVLNEDGTPQNAVVDGRASAQQEAITSLFGTGSDLDVSVNEDTGDVTFGTDNTNVSAEDEDVFAEQFYNTKEFLGLNHVWAPKLSGNAPSPEPGANNNLAKEYSRDTEQETACRDAINNLFTELPNSDLQSQEKPAYLSYMQSLGWNYEEVRRIPTQTERTCDTNFLSLNRGDSYLQRFWRNFSLKDKDIGNNIIAKLRSTAQKSNDIGDLATTLIAELNNRVTAAKSGNLTASEKNMAKAILKDDNFKEKLSKAYSTNLTAFNDLLNNLDVGELRFDNPKLAQELNHKNNRALCLILDINSNGTVAIDPAKLMALTATQTILCYHYANTNLKDPFLTSNLWADVEDSKKEKVKKEYFNSVSAQDFITTAEFLFKDLLGINVSEYASDYDVAPMKGTGSLILQGMCSGSQNNAGRFCRVINATPVRTLLPKIHREYQSRNDASPVPRISFLPPNAETLDKTYDEFNSYKLNNATSALNEVSTDALLKGVSTHFDNGFLLGNISDKKLGSIIDKECSDILHSKGQPISQNQKKEIKAMAKEAWHRNTVATDFIEGFGRENVSCFLCDIDSRDDLKYMTSGRKASLQSKLDQYNQEWDFIDRLHNARVSALMAFTKKNRAKCDNAIRNEDYSAFLNPDAAKEAVGQHYINTITKSLRVNGINTGRDPRSSKLVRVSETNLKGYTVTKGDTLASNQLDAFRYAFLQMIGLDIWKLEPGQVESLYNEAVKIANTNDLLPHLQNLAKGTSIVDDERTAAVQAIKSYVKALKDSNFEVKTPHGKVGLGDIKTEEPAFLHAMSEFHLGLNLARGNIGKEVQSSLYVEIDGKSCGPSTRVIRFSHQMTLDDFKQCNRCGFLTSIAGQMTDLRALPEKLDKEIDRASKDTELSENAKDRYIKSLQNYRNDIVSWMKTDGYSQMGVNGSKWIKDIQSKLTSSRAKDSDGDTWDSKTCFAKLSNLLKDTLGISLEDINRKFSKKIGTPLTYGSGPRAMALNIAHEIMSSFEKTFSDFHAFLAKHPEYSNKPSMLPKELIKAFADFKYKNTDKASIDKAVNYFNNFSYVFHFTCKVNKADEGYDGFSIGGTHPRGKNAGDMFSSIISNLESDVKPLIIIGKDNIFDAFQWQSSQEDVLSNNIQILVTNPLIYGAKEFFPKGAQQTVNGLTALTSAMNKVDSFVFGLAYKGARYANNNHLSASVEKDLFRHDGPLSNCLQHMSIPCSKDGCQYYTSNFTKTLSTFGNNADTALTSVDIDGVNFETKPMMYTTNGIGVAGQPGITQGSGDADGVMRITDKLTDSTSQEMTNNFMDMFDGINNFLNDLKNMADIIGDSIHESSKQNISLQLLEGFNKFVKYFNAHPELFSSTYGLMSNNNRVILESMCADLITATQALNNDAPTGSTKANVKALKNGTDLVNVFQNICKDLQKVLTDRAVRHQAQIYAYNGVPTSVSNDILDSSWEGSIGGLLWSEQNFDLLNQAHSGCNPTAKALSETGSIQYPSTARYMYSKAENRLVYGEPNGTSASYDVITTKDEWNLIPPEAKQDFLERLTTDYINSEPGVISQIRSSLVKPNFNKDAATTVAANVNATRNKKDRFTASEAIGKLENLARNEKQKVNYLMSVLNNIGLSAKHYKGSLKFSDFFNNATVVNIPTTPGKNGSKEVAQDVIDAVLAEHTLSDKEKTKLISSLKSNSVPAFYFNGTIYIKDLNKADKDNAISILTSLCHELVHKAIFDDLYNLFHGGKVENGKEKSHIVAKLIRANDSVARGICDSYLNMVKLTLGRMINELSGNTANIDVSSTSAELAYLMQQVNDIENDFSAQNLASAGNKLNELTTRVIELYTQNDGKFKTVFNNVFGDLTRGVTIPNVNEVINGMLQIVPLFSETLISNNKPENADNMFNLCQEIIAWGASSSSFNTFLKSDTLTQAANSEIRKNIKRNQANNGKYETGLQNITPATVDPAQYGVNANIFSSIKRTLQNALKGIVDFISSLLTLLVKNGSAKFKDNAHNPNVQDIYIDAADVIKAAPYIFQQRTDNSAAATGQVLNQGFTSTSTSEANLMNKLASTMNSLIKNTKGRVSDSADIAYRTTRLVRSARQAGFLKTNEQKELFKGVYAALSMNLAIKTNEGNKLLRLGYQALKNIGVENMIPNFDKASQSDQNLALSKYKWLMALHSGDVFKNSRVESAKVSLAMMLVDPTIRASIPELKLRQGTSKSESKPEAFIYDTLNSMVSAVDKKISDKDYDTNAEHIIKDYAGAVFDAIKDNQLPKEMKGAFTRLLDSADKKTGSVLTKGIIKIASAVQKAPLPKAAQECARATEEFMKFMESTDRSQHDRYDGWDAWRSIGHSVLERSGILHIPVIGNFIDDIFFREAANTTRLTTKYYTAKKQARTQIQQLSEKAREKTPVRIKEKVTFLKDKESWKSATKMFIKGAIYKDNTLTRQNCLDYLKNPEKLKQEIRNIGVPSRVISQTNTLIKFVQDGTIEPAKQKDFLRNTYMIAKMNNISEQTASRLYALLSLKYLSENHKSDTDRMISFLEKDTTNEQYNYLNGVLAHRYAEDRLKLEEYAQVSNGKYGCGLSCYFEGYIPKIMSSGYSVKATRNADEVKKYLTLGYEKVDKISPNGITYLESKYDLEAQFLSGGLNSVNITAMGVNLANGRASDAVFADFTQQAMQTGSETEPCIPVYDKNGSIVGYELLPDSSIMSKMDFDTNLANIVGEWSGRFITEHSVREANKKVLEELKDLKTKDSHVLNKNEYINILNPNAIMNLPKYQKKAIERLINNPCLLADVKEVFGDEGLPIRRDMIDDVLGMQRASITDIYLDNNEFPKFVNDALKAALYVVGGPKGAVTLEKTIQSLAKVARNNIVIKSVVVPAANITANAIQLMLMGVPPQYIIKNIYKMTKECNQYLDILDQMATLDITQQNEGTSSISKAKIEEQKTALQLQIDTLSIAPMINAGEFSTISDGVLSRDEIDMDKSSASFVDKFVNKASNFVQDHPNIRAATFAKGSTTYNYLQYATQYGDFIAKSILYNYMTEVKHESENEALYKATTFFVNYDFMPSRGRDFLESIGYMWFFNYKLRMSKVMVDLIKNHPVRSLFFTYLPIELWDVTLDTPFKDSALGKALGLGVPNSSSVGIDNLFKLKNLVPQAMLLDTLMY